jgi:predicted tellurium resistance membrane protein TerC
MDLLLTLLQQSIFITSIDIDNATYTTSAIQRVKPEQQQSAIFWSTGLEFIGRLSLVALFLFLTNEEEPLFTLFGVEFTIESISLFGAGTFLLISNGRELVNFFRTKGQLEEDPHPITAGRFRDVLFQMGLVLTVLSIDTVLAGLGVATGLFSLIFLFLVSAIVRLLFVRQIAAFVRKYPAINIVILTFLVLIGAELILQGFGPDFEPIFNTVLMIAIAVAIIYHRRRAPVPVSSTQ